MKHMGRALTHHRPNGELMRLAHEHADGIPVDRDDDPTREPMTWTIDQIKAASGVAGSRAFGASILRADARDAAWEGVALHIVENPESSWYDAVSAGQRAVSLEAGAILRAHGVVGGSTTPRFATYWDRSWDQTPQPTRVIEPLALRQVLEALTPQSLEAILVRSVTATDAAAGEVLGVSQVGFSRVMRAARREFFALWFDWEPAPEPDRRLMGLPARHDDDECKHGHPWSENTEYATNHGRRIRRCRTCQRAAQARYLARRTAA